jgi:hypothetical protein
MVTFLATMVLGGLGLPGNPILVKPAAASPLQIGHLVGPGEDLHLLAAYYYGDARQWKKIYRLNRFQIRNPNRIRPQQVLRIDLPDGWKPALPFSAWMKMVKGSSFPGSPTGSRQAPLGGEGPAAGPGQ